MGIPVPTLSVAGWVKSPAMKADFIIAYFFETEVTQTILFAGMVESIQSIIAANTNSVSSIAQKTKDYLGRELNRYYEKVDLQVVTNEYEPEAQNGDVDLRIYCNVTDDGVTYSFAHLITMINSKFSKISRLNDEGNQST